MIRITRTFGPTVSATRSLGPDQALRSVSQQTASDVVFVAGMRGAKGDAGSAQIIPPDDIGDFVSSLDGALNV